MVCNSLVPGIFGVLRWVDGLLPSTEALERSISVMIDLQVRLKSEKLAVGTTNEPRE